MRWTPMLSLSSCTDFTPIGRGAFKSGLEMESMLQHFGNLATLTVSFYSSVSIISDLVPVYYRTIRTGTVVVASIFVATDPSTRLAKAPCP